jgi:transcriptional regulator with XRE-family HTH domain
MEERDPELLRRFGAHLALLRKRAGFTSQEKFAYHCEMDRTYVGDVERGKRNVSLRNLDRFAQKLGMSLSQLFEDFGGAEH